MIAALTVLLGVVVVGLMLAAATGWPAYLLVMAADVLGQSSPKARRDYGAAERARRAVAAAR